MASRVVGPNAASPEDRRVSVDWKAINRLVNYTSTVL